MERRQQGNEEAWPTQKTVKSQNRRAPPTRTRQAASPITEQKTLSRPEPIYQSFPHRHSPLFHDMVPWAQQGAYFVIHLRATRNIQDYRFLHSHCKGIKSQALQDEVREFSHSQPIIVIDLARYPMLASDSEWVYWIKSVNESYVDCTCSYIHYTLRDPEVQCEFYRIEEPYFYLCNFSISKEYGQNARLPDDQIAYEASEKERLERVSRAVIEQQY